MFPFVRAWINVGGASRGKAYGDNYRSSVCNHSAFCQTRKSTCEDIHFMRRMVSIAAIEKCSRVYAVLCAAGAGIVQSVGNHLA